MYKDLLKYYPGFPIEGVNFVDILPFLQDKETFKNLTRDLGTLVTCPNIVAPEARGFLFAAPLLVIDSKVENIITLRKRGKTPYVEGDLVTVDIVKEYGKDTVFFRKSDILAGVPDGDTFHISFVDDILATGGTARGIVEALNALTVEKDGKEYKIKVDEFVFLVELDALKGADHIKDLAPVKSLIHLDGVK